MIADDIAGEYAIQRLELAYLRRRADDATERELADLREAIRLARGWS